MTNSAEISTNNLNYRNNLFTILDILNEAKLTFSILKITLFFK